MKRSRLWLLFPILSVFMIIFAYWLSRQEGSYKQTTELSFEPVQDMFCLLYTSYDQGSITLVLLSGSGVPFPSLEYKTLAKALAKTYQVIGIEKLGYGRSDLTENNRQRLS